MVKQLLNPRIADTPSVQYHFNMPSDKTSASETQYQLALVRTPHIGPHTYRRLMKHFGSAKNLFASTKKNLHRLKLKEDTLNAIIKPDWKNIAQDISWLDAPDHHFITLLQPEYPHRLKQIHNPPPGLFITGNPAALHHPQLAIVGSRNPTHTGRELAAQLAGLLGQAGLTITSGLALGIDAASHRGALHAGANTIAVLGNGLRTIYPYRHRQLAADITAQGAIVSEFALDAAPHPGHFPRRNRIISGLSLGTLVVEATLKSGSLITAQLAAEQGREVFAVPSSVKSPLSKGCHALLQQGAKLVATPEDVLEELNLTPQPNVLTMPTFSRTSVAQQLDETQRKLVECIGFENTSVDEIIKRSGFPVAQVNSMLLIIELHGYIKPAVDGYIRVK